MGILQAGALPPLSLPLDATKETGQHMELLHITRLPQTMIVCCLALPLKQANSHCAMAKQAEMCCADAEQGPDKTRSAIGQHHGSNNDKAETELQRLLQLLPLRRISEIRPGKNT
jgi:hypothetical protein